MNCIKALVINYCLIYGVIVCGILIILSILSSPIIVLAQTKTCECRFQSKDYHAYGTDGACGIFMYNNGKTCEISFAGAGANEQLLKTILGNDAWKTHVRFTPRLFQQYHSYTQEGNEGLFLSSDFIRDSLIVLVRGAIFRKTVYNKNIPLKEIDTTFVRFSTKYSGTIAEIFQGKKESFDVAWEYGTVFTIGKGFVEMIVPDLATIRVVYFVSF